MHQNGCSIPLPALPGHIFYTQGFWPLAYSKPPFSERLKKGKRRIVTCLGAIRCMLEWQTHRTVSSGAVLPVSDDLS